MMRTLSLTQFLPVRQTSSKYTRVSSRLVVAVPKNSAKITPARAVSREWTRIIGLILILLNAGLLISHIVFTNTDTVRGYKVTNLRNYIAELVQQNKKLVLQTAETASIVQVREIAAESNFVPVTNAEFLHSPDTLVTQR